MSERKSLYVKIVEEVLGKPLPKGAVVHHIDGDRDNNAKENLCVLQNRRVHNELHRNKKVLDAGGNPKTHKICTHCSEIKEKSEFCRRNSPLYTDGLNNICSSCVKEISANWRKERNPARYREYKKLYRSGFRSRKEVSK